VLEHNGRIIGGLDVNDHRIGLTVCLARMCALSNTVLPARKRR
jgi:hypothetical protein